MLSDPRLVPLCHDLASKYTRWTIGCSGGPDSFALLHRVTHLIRTEHLPVTLLVVSCHHGRASADKELADVAQRCRDHHINRYSHYRDPTLSQDERSLRIRRHQCFMTTMQEHNSSLLMIGHHQDDQCETMLLHLMRGCKLAGLVALPLIDRHFLDPRIIIVRPFIFFPKHKLVSYCDYHKLPYHYDPTNTDSSVSERNRLRNTIKPNLKDALIRLRHDIDGLYDHIILPHSSITARTHPFGHDILLRTVPLSGPWDTIDELVRIMRRCGSYHNLSRAMLQTLRNTLSRLRIGKRFHQGKLYWLRMHDNRWILRSSTPCWITPPVLDQTLRTQISAFFPGLPSVWGGRQRYHASSITIKGKKYTLTEYARSQRIPRPLRKRCLCINELIAFPSLHPLDETHT